MSKINLYNCDCIEFMKSVPDKFYDLAIVDPPYGIGEANGKNATRNEGFGIGNKKSKKVTFSKDYGKKNWDSKPPTQKYFNELKRVSKNQIIFGANHFISLIPFDSSCWIVWDKDNGESDFSDCELAYTSFKTAVRKFKFRWNGMLQQNMKNKETRIHPTQKPVALYRWLLQKYAKQGDKILDTHGGSFNQAIACDIEGFDLDIMDIDEEYFIAGKKAFDMHVSQKRLF